MQAALQHSIYPSDLPKLRILAIDFIIIKERIKKIIGLNY